MRTPIAWSGAATRVNDRLSWSSRLARILIASSGMRGSAARCISGKHPRRQLASECCTSFLDRGFDAFRNIADARTFLQTIREREVQLMEQLFAGGGEEVFTARSQ